MVRPGSFNVFQESLQTATTCTELKAALLSSSYDQKTRLSCLELLRAHFQALSKEPQVYSRRISKWDLWRPEAPEVGKPSNCQTNYLPMPHMWMLDSLLYSSTSVSHHQLASTKYEMNCLNGNKIYVHWYNIQYSRHLALNTLMS